MSLDALMRYIPVDNEERKRLGYEILTEMPWLVDVRDGKIFFVYGDVEFTKEFITDAEVEDVGSVEKVLRGRRYSDWARFESSVRTSCGDAGWGTEFRVFSPTIEKAPKRRKKKTGPDWECKYCGAINPDWEYQCGGCGTRRTR